MTHEEYLLNVKEIDKAAEAAKHQLMKEYVDSNNKYKIGDKVQTISAL